MCILCRLSQLTKNAHEKSDNLKAYYFCMLYSFHTKCSSFSAPVNNSNFISREALHNFSIVVMVYLKTKYSWYVIMFGSIWLKMLVRQQKKMWKRRSEICTIDSSLKFIPWKI